MPLEILHLESALEEAIAVPELKRSQATALTEFLKSLPATGPASAVVYCERVHNLADLRLWLGRCTLQNEQQRRVDESAATKITVVHLSSHGSGDQVWLSNSKGTQPKELGAAFSLLRGSGVKLVVLSSCSLGASEEVARAVLKSGSGVKAVVGYFNTTQDHTCLLAEQMLYYQLALRPSRPIHSMVRRVNDALWLLGEPEARMLSCWVPEGADIIGPGPWWKADLNVAQVRERGNRSFLEDLTRIVEKKGQQRKAKYEEMRILIRALAKKS